MQIVVWLTDLIFLFTSLEVLCQNIERLALLAIILNDHTATADNLASLTLLVNLAQAGPFTELLIVINLDEVNAMLCTQSLYKLRIHRLITVVGEHAQMGLALVQCLRALVQASRQPIVNEGCLEHLLYRCVQVHRTRRHRCNGRCNRGIISFRV